MYKWDVTEFSQASTVFYIVNAVVTIGVVPLLSNKLRLHEAALGLIGMLSLTSKMAVTSAAVYEGLFYYGETLFTNSFIKLPCNHQFYI